MNLFERMKNGWKLAKISFATINDHRQLLLFPVFSSIALVAVLASFFGGTFLLLGGQIESLLESNEEMGEYFGYAVIFVYYLISYFVIVFFNSALIFCAVKILEDEPTTLMEGISFANRRIGKILSWAVVAATVGLLLQILSNRGKAAEIAASIIGGVWSILTFFVVPVLIFQDKNVFGSIKESGRLIRDKWGESLGASVSFGLINFLGFLAAAGLGFAVGYFVHAGAGVAVGVLALLLLIIVVSTARTVFVAAVYNRVVGQPTGDFDDETLDGVFFSRN